MGIIMHNNISYGGGSSIEPNPQESATDQLETIGIDGDVYEVTDANAIHTSDVGVANGVAELDANGFVPSSQLPSYVDDVLEYASRSAFPATGETGKIYVALDTNLTYRWGGSDYVEISPSLALGETSSTAYRGDRGKIAYDHSQSDHSGIKPAFTEASTRANIASGETIATIFGKIKKFFSDLKTVAFTGAYSDLSGTPTIPTVNDGTLTIKQNNNNLGTFTANQSTASNINIECALPSDVEGSKVATGNPLTITDAAGIKAEKIEIGFEPQQAGSGTPSPSNIRPITGYTSLSANRCGKNIIPVNSFNGEGYVFGTNYASTSLHLNLTEGKYTLSEIMNGSGATQFQVWKKDGDTYTRIHNNVYYDDFTSTFTADSDGVYSLSQYSNNSSNQFTNIQLEKSPSATTYEPFKGDNVTVQFGQTLYGGKLTILQDGSADIDVDTGFDTFTSAINKSSSTTNDGYYLGAISDMKVPTDNTIPAEIIANEFEVYSAAALYQGNVYGISGNTTKEIYVFFGKGNITTTAQATTFLTNNPLQISYKLATPFTLHLSPVETLNLLQGINNVWTDGTTLSLTYQPDNAIGQAKGTAQELVDSASTWKLFAESANANIALPTNCKELYICVIYVTGSTSAIMYNFHILPDTLTKATSYFRQGDYYTPDNFSRCEIRIRKTSSIYDTRVEALYMNNTTDRSRHENTTVKVYYR